MTVAVLLVTILARTLLFAPHAKINLNENWKHLLSQTFAPHAIIQIVANNFPSAVSVLQILIQMECLTLLGGIWHLDRNSGEAICILLDF